MYRFVSIHGVLIIKLECCFNIQHYNINILENNYYLHAYPIYFWAKYDFVIQDRKLFWRVDASFALSMLFSEIAVSHPYNANYNRTYWEISLVRKSLQYL